LQQTKKIPVCEFCGFHLQVFWRLLVPAKA
jgi:hypothetical protein